MSELKTFTSERIYWAVEQVERKAGDIDDLHLDDNLFYMKSEVDALLAEKDKEIESMKASHYAEMVDAGMRERRLKRALWIARAERAADRERIFYFNDLKTMLDIDGYSYDSNKKKGHKKLTARCWRIIWEKVESKLRAKAEEYK